MLNRWNFLKAGFYERIKVGQDFGGYAFGFPYQSKQDVLGPDVVVVEPLGFFLRVGQNATRPF